MQTDDTPFADIICNILGVMILLTSLGSFASFLVNKDQTSEPEKNEPQSEHPSLVPNWQMLPPFSTYYLVSEGGIVELDLSSIARMLVENTDVLTGRIGGITYELTDRWYFHKAGQPSLGRWEERDYDAYWLKIAVDMPVLLERTQAPQSPEDLSVHVEESRRMHGKSTTFLVYASGMDRFTSIYHKLTQEKSRFRWVALKDGSPITLYRSAGQDQVYEYRR
jgi:hypothetical protein